MYLVLAFLAVLLLSFAMVAFFTRQTLWEKAVQQRVGAIQQARYEDRDRQLDAERILKAEHSEDGTPFERFISRYEWARKFQTLSLQSGTGWRIAPFLLFSLGAGGTAFLAALLFFPALLLDLIVAAAALYAPYFFLRHRSAARLKAFNTALPDAIDMMARALRAGHSLSSAIEVLSEQAGEVVAAEFAIVFRQQNFGLPLRDALLELAGRVPSQDLRFWVTAMLIQKETGGNLTEILDRTTHVIRERIRIEGEVRVHTAQGRLTGWILALLPAVMLFLLNLVNPGYSHVLLHDPVGQKLLYAGVGLIVIGAFFIRRIVDIQV